MVDAKTNSRAVAGTVLTSGKSRERVEGRGVFDRVGEYMGNSGWSLEGEGGEQMEKRGKYEEVKGSRIDGCPIMQS